MSRANYGMTIKELEGLFQIIEEEISTSEADQALENMLKYQTGQRKPVLTGTRIVDASLPNGVMGQMVFIGSRPSMGKTYNCSEVIQTLLNEKLNDPVKVFRMNLEMKTESLILRDIAKKLDRKYKDIYSREFTEEEKRIIHAEVLPLYKHPNLLDWSKKIPHLMIGSILDKYCQKHSDTNKVVLIDHIHILESKEEIDNFLDELNMIKMKYDNIGFIIYFQFGRKVEEVWTATKEKKVNHGNLFPSSEHIYMTDRLQQYADLVVGITRPSVVGLEEFSRVPKEINQHMMEHFTTESRISDSRYGTLKGRNRVYYNIVKFRMEQDEDDMKFDGVIINEKYEPKAPVGAQIREKKEVITKMEDMSGTDLYFEEDEMF